MDWNKLRIDLNSILFRVRINEHFMYKSWTDIFDSKLQKFTMVIKILTNGLYQLTFIDFIPNQNKHTI